MSVALINARIVQQHYGGYCRRCLQTPATLRALGRMSNNRRYTRGKKALARIAQCVASARMMELMSSIQRPSCGLRAVPCPGSLAEVRIGAAADMKEQRCEICAST